jgi:hypothetical protein
MQKYHNLLMAINFADMLEISVFFTSTQVMIFWICFYGIVGEQ